MKAGPKSAPTGKPLHLQSLPKSGSARVVAFIERYCRVPKGSAAVKAGSRIKLLPWQLDVIGGLFDDPRPRQALISISRKNGKSVLAACIALYALLGDGEEGAEVLIVSSDERTAMVTFRLARRMVELEPRLAGILQVFQDKIYHPASDSILEVLAGDASRAQGRNPSLAIVDEVHVSSPDMWDAMALGTAARSRPLTLGISTECGPDPDNLMARLVDHGREDDDPAFFFREFTSDPGCELSDPQAWEAANPSLGVTVTTEHLAALVKTTREAAFRRYHLNQRVALDGAWMPHGAWAACAEPSRTLSGGTEWVLAMDGSYSGDCTALVACSISPRPHLEVVGLWQPSKAEPVDILLVEETIRAACGGDRYTRVREVVADPYRWARSLQLLDSQGFPIVEFPQSAGRMTPATNGLYEAVTNRQVTHSGDAELARHVANAVVKDDARGTRIAKPSRDSVKRIDLAVCAVMAHSRAAFLATRPVARRRVVGFR